MLKISQKGAGHIHVLFCNARFNFPFLSFSNATTYCGRDLFRLPIQKLTIPNIKGKLGFPCKKLNLHLPVLTISGGSAIQAYENMNLEPGDPKTDHPLYVVVGKTSSFDPEFVYEIFFCDENGLCCVYLSLNKMIASHLRNRGLQPPKQM